MSLISQPCDVIKYLMLSEFLPQITRTSSCNHFCVKTSVCRGVSIHSASQHHLPFLASCFRTSVQSRLHTSPCQPANAALSASIHSENTIHQLQSTGRNMVKFRLLLDLNCLLQFADFAGIRDLNDDEMLNVTENHTVELESGLGWGCP